MGDRHRMYTWYVEPLDSYTNQVVATRISEENAHDGIRCEDGISRNLWECSHSFIAELKRSQEDLGVRFKVFCREGKSGAVREWKFEKSGSKSADVRLLNLKQYVLRRMTNKAEVIRQALAQYDEEKRNRP